jgi:tRNA pseudouridine(55) synthase
MSKTPVPPYVVLHKKRGETPLELLTAWQASHSELKNVRLSYAGRLDPMAEGKMLVLLGDECKKQMLYTKLDKEYEIEVLLDLKTDTGDVLGFPAMSEKRAVHVTADIKAALAHEHGSRSRKYPAYSSKTVHGKPLFLYALENTLSTITIPEHIEKIYSLAHMGTETLSKDELQKRIEQSLALVPRSDEPSKILGADFRQDEVRARWQELFSKVPARTFIILTLRVTCGSGSYMRTLAERIGMSLGSTGLALSIKRTRIGKFVELGPVGFWFKQF